MKAHFLAVIFVMGSVNAASAYESTHMTQFRFEQCFSEKCVRAIGDRAFFSQGNDSMTAKNVTLEMNQGSILKFTSYTCADFRVDFHSQFLICNNQEIPGLSTFTIDSKFRISISASNSKRTKS